MKDLSVAIRQSRSVLDAFKEMVIAGKVSQVLAARTHPDDSSPDFAVYFADSGSILYQLEAWITPLERLTSAGLQVVLIIKSASVAREIAQKTSLPIFLTRSISAIESFVSLHQITGIFYVNNSQANFTALRLTKPAHIHLNHGESEKSSMVSNQLKAYDFAFISGDAAEDRIFSTLKRVRPSALVKIGRPQLDVTDPLPRIVSHIRRKTVLYAPTWEGDSVDMAYSSLCSLGLRMVREILADDRFTLVFRPHPKTGSWSQETARALKEINTRIQRAAKDDPKAMHRIEVLEDPTLSILRSDVVVADISAMAMDAVGLGKRLLLLDSTKPSAGYSTHDRPTMKRAVQSLQFSFSASFPDCLAVIANNPVPEEQEEFRTYVFGDRSCGSGTTRFVDACKALKANQEEIVS